MILLFKYWDKIFNEQKRDNRFWLPTFTQDNKSIVVKNYSSQEKKHMFKGKHHFIIFIQVLPQRQKKKKTIKASQTVYWQKLSLWNGMNDHVSLNANNRLYKYSRDRQARPTYLGDCELTSSCRAGQGRADQL